ncbi:LOW QUALITY PROTEIN: apoptosis inhibitor 5-like [Pollicipes pollicipes]|uniref:LOW QUALITY PROTEIN: apoptosis inhibitor 5-like n=1 Tax=Pollicipes pollicipes TaxID=41117 RepID=UPI001885836A|nr:LOW QUALITY PROTEIN: apoptosis inhibitor 5-like [Pollicipes pollicipes]
MDIVERLYKNFEILSSAKDQAKNHEKEYLEILEAVKGNANEKRLASQFIARFFKHFPSLADQTIDSILDLCEDEDTSIRKQAIKDLPQLCRESRTFLPKIADVLAQLLQSDDTSEIKEVHSSLTVLFKIDAKGTLYGLFSQIQSEEMEDSLIRERAIKYLAAKVKTFDSDVMTKEAQEILWNETKKSLKDVTGEEFVQFVDILSGTQTGRTVSGHQQLLQLICDQLDAATKVELADPEARDKLLLCVRQAVRFVSRQTRATQLVAYLIDAVVPRLGQLPADAQLELLKPLAEMAQYTGELEGVEARLERLHAALVERMPLPPPPTEENGAVAEPPSLEFSHIECLMFTLHQLARRAPAWFTDDADRLKDFRLRLQYLARGTQGYIKSLREALKDADLKSEENKIRAVALKTTSNINTMIKDLFHTPPSYKSTISLSWKPMTGTAAGQKATEPAAAPAPARSGEKRRVPITFGGADSANKSKDGRRMYQPPSGKYSDRAGGYREQTSPRGARGGRGRHRGGRY